MRENTLKAVVKCAAVGAAATAGIAALNAAIARKASPLVPGTDGQARVYDWDGGRVGYTEAGAGRPMVLLHSHNAAASSYEMRRAFQEFERDHRVFAPDLPGYGTSERRSRLYSAQTYVRFMHDFLHDVVGQPAVVVACSVTAAQVILAAAEDPAAISALVVVSPTGLTESRIAPPPFSRMLAGLFGIPVWGQAAFNAIVSRAGLRYYDERKVYDNPWNVTHALLDYNWNTSHQPGAIHAPHGFVSGALWADARAAYRDLRCPLLAVWGERDAFNPYAASAPVLGANPTAAVSIITNSGAIPHAEQPAEFARVVRQFLSGA